MNTENTENTQAPAEENLPEASSEQVGEPTGSVTLSENGFVLFSFNNQQLLVRASEISSVSFAETGSPAVKIVIGRKPAVIAFETKELGLACFNQLAGFVTSLSGFIGTKLIKAEVSL